MNDANLEHAIKFEKVGRTSHFRISESQSGGRNFNPNPTNSLLISLSHLASGAVMDPTLLINDVVEREPAKPPSNDVFDDQISSTGFPAHKRRWKSSTFKQRRAGNASAADSTEAPKDSAYGMKSSSTTATFEQVEKERIDRENRQKLDDMSPEEIAAAQQELLNGMNPGLVQRLLQRANIDENAPQLPVEDTPQPTQRQPEPEPKAGDTPKPKVRFAGVANEEDEPETVLESQPVRAGSKLKLAPDYDEDAEPAQRPDLFPITDIPHKTHFPAAKQRELDPADPNFLETLHEKYFPELPADPSKLAWMAPTPTPNSTADRESPYYPHEEIPVSALRFDFKGRFLSPRVSRSIPSTKGLHNHGEAPEAAGYTVEELALLARSAVPAQRCIAFQTLGRILYRLGKGEWGTTENHPIAIGIWDAAKKGRVLETLSQAAAVEGGHRGSQAYAMEALWLFEKGGWREQHKGR